MELQLPQLQHQQQQCRLFSKPQQRAQQRYRHHSSPARRKARVAASSAPTLSSLSMEQPAQTHEDWEALFKQADLDGNGLIDPEELRGLLQESNKDMPPGTLDYVARAAVNKAKVQSGDPDSCGLTLEEFKQLMQGGLLISQRLREYHDAFRAADESGNGTLSGVEVQALLEKMGQKLTTGKLFQIMEKYDRDKSGQLDFAEFLGMFSEDLLDLQELQRFLHMDAIPSCTWPLEDGKLIQAQEGGVTMVFTADELDYLLQANAEKLTVVEASLTWCRPCMSFERTFEKFADFYRQAIFIKFYGNTNESTKGLFTHRFKIPKTPTFLFLRAGTVHLQYTGTRKEKMDEALQKCLLPEENPLHEASPFKRQVWHSKLGLT